MKKNKKVQIIIVLAFLLFLSIMDYPFLSRIYNEKVQGGVVTDYTKYVDQESEEAKEQMRKEAQEYNEQLALDSQVKIEQAFSGENQEDQTYEQLLGGNDDGVMAVIEIPKIDLTLPIYHGCSDDVLQNGAGHLRGSSLPIGGESTHACIAAHRGLPSKKMFTDLDQIEEGDIFYIYVLGETLAYQVYNIETVTPDQIEPLAIKKGEDLVTLITCTPYGINTHRLYVHGRRIELEEEQEEVIQQVKDSLWKILKQNWWLVATILAILWMTLLLYIYNRKGNNKKNQ
jgi:sortase A